MTASKENCRKAIMLLQKVVPGPGPVFSLDFVSQFLEAAEKRLPTEAAIKKDRERRKLLAPTPRPRQPIRSRPF